MVDNDSQSSSGIVPRDDRFGLVLPVDMAHRGLELAIRIERQQGIEQYDRPILKLPGALSRSCVNISGNGRVVAITSHGEQNDNPGLVIWDVDTRVLSILPEAGSTDPAAAQLYIARVMVEEPPNAEDESSSISTIKIPVSNTMYMPIGHPEAMIRHIYSVALSKHGEQAVIGYGDGSVLRCDVGEQARGNFRIIAKDPSGRPVGAIAFSPDDRIIAECGELEVRIRDAASGREIKRLSGRNPYYNQIAFSDDGRQLLMARGKHTQLKGAWGSFMTLVDLSDREEPVRFGGDRIRAITAVSFFPSDQKVVSLDDSGVVSVWDATNGDEIAHWKHTEADVNDIVAEKQLAGNLKLQTRNPIIWGLSSVAVSPDGERILSGGGDTYMRLWTAGGKELWAYPHESRVVKVKFLPDRRRALAGCWDGSVYLWGLP